MSTEPQSQLEVWTRRGINAATVATSFGFYTAKKTTQMGFGIARGVTSTVLTIGSTILSPITPAPLGSGLLISHTVTSSLNALEHLAILPLDIGQALTSHSLTLASSSLDVLTSLFGTSEASFSLAEFVTLVRREWSEPVLGERLPSDWKERAGVLSIGRALIAWAALQCATRGWHEDRWRSGMREIGNEEWTERSPELPEQDFDTEDDGASIRSVRGYKESIAYRKRNASVISRNSRVFVREDVFLPDQAGQIISAEIGEKWDVGLFAQLGTSDQPPQPLKMGEIRLNLRRLSKMVLGGYGGASLLFFGLPYPGQQQHSGAKNTTQAAQSSTTTSSKGKEALRPTHTNVPDITLQEEGEVLAQLFHEADDEELTAGSSTLASAAPSTFPTPFPTMRKTHHKRGDSSSYPNSAGYRSPTARGGIPFPSVSTTNLPSSSAFASPTLAMSSGAHTTSSSEHSPTTGRDANNNQPSTSSESGPTPTVPGWWEILSGSKDQEIFEGFVAAAHAAEDIREGAREARKELNRDKQVTAVIGAVNKMPRFWVLTDHARRQVVLVLRGTMSLNELAVDLTCEPVDFEPHISKRIRRQSTASLRSPFLVHGGMFKMAQMMGGKGMPVHAAVMSALRRNRGYELVMSGHSLGAAVAGLLALIWADPTTCMTVGASGLPVGRKVSAYCIAPPCFTSAELSRLSSPMITSFVYSHDIVSRLSLGSLRDLSRACWWLSAGKGEESCSSVIRRSWGLEISTGLGWWGKGGEKQKKREEDTDFLLSLRKTLEANMHMADLYPAGNVFWALHENDIDPEALPSSAVNSTVASSKLRLFLIERVEKVFDQIIFSRDMLSSHMPHNYDRMLHEYL